MKKLNIIMSLLLLAGLSVKAQTQMQIEFEKFLELFPTMSWNELCMELNKYDYEIADSRDLIPYKFIRRNMWYEEPQNGPNNIYNHIRNEIKSADYDFTTPPPHIIDIDGDYIHYENVGGYFAVYPLGKVGVSDDIVVIVLLNIKDEKLSGSIECYTFRKSTQQMISAYVLFSQEIAYYSLSDFSLVIFENFGRVEIAEDRYTDLLYRHRKEVNLLQNGYFAELNLQTGLYEYFGYVQDKDGYANVRKSPDINSDVQYQVADSSYIVVCGEPDAKWFEVIRLREPSNTHFSVTKRGGYIHRSRLKGIEKWRKGLYNTDIKE